MSIVYDFGGYELDGRTLELRCSGASIAIEPTPLRVLLHLVEQRHRVVTKDDLRRAVWRDAVVGDAAVAGALRDVRRALGDDGRQQRWIRSRQRVGYQFVGKVEIRGRAYGTHAVSRPRGRVHGGFRGLSKSFTGRAQELARLEGMFAPAVRGSAHVAIEGLAGIGKTELALQLGHKLAHDGVFPGGVFWLDAETPDLLRAWGTRIAEQLGVRTGAVDERAARVLAALEDRTDAAILIVLDNVASWAADARPAPLPSGPHVNVLATTRLRKLGGAGFSHLPLDVLCAPHDRDLLELLAQRPLAADADRLLERLGGHPLALELAGAFLGTYPGETPSAYLAALEQDAEASERPLRDRVGYEGTVAQAFCAVWERLSAHAREAWWLGSFFDSEPVTREVSAACGIAPQSLRALEENHLIQSTGGAWTMHRLTREFGAHMPPERSRALELLTPMGQHVLPRSHLTTELQRIYRAASSLLQEQEVDPDQAALALLGIWYAALVSGNSTHSLELASVIEEFAWKSGPERYLFTGYLTRCVSAFHAGRPLEAIDWYERALALDDRFAVDLLGWADSRANLLAHAGLAELWLGFPDRALHTLRSGDALAAASTSYVTRSMHAGTTALCHYWRGEYDAAVTLASQISSLEETSSTFATFVTMWGIGAQISRGGPDVEAALGNLQQGMQRRRESQSGVLSLQHYCWLSEACQRLGRRDDALRALDDGDAWLERSGERLLEAELWRRRAALADVPAERVQHLERAIQIATQQGSRWLALHAATDLLEATTPQERAGAHTRLQTLYDSFTEGFELPALQRARALLSGSPSRSAVGGEAPESAGLSVN